MGWFGWLIVLLVVTGAYWGVYFSWFTPALPPPYSLPIAEDDDYAEVDYRGWFPDTGRTFDTSIEAVARDNASYPKAPSFSFRSDGGYAPLGFVVGCSGGAECPIPAFQEAVRGLRLQGTVIVVLPPEKAYGAADPSRIHVRPLFEDVPATETMTPPEFQSRYGSSPTEGSVVADRVWGWNATVHVAGGVVTVRHSPTLGQRVTIAERWPAQITAIDDAANEGSGRIEMHHLLTAFDVNAFVAEDPTGNFQVVALDPVAGTFTVDYNNAVVGKTLAFQITLTSLRKANP